MHPKRCVKRPVTNTGGRRRVAAAEHLPGVASDARSPAPEAPQPRPGLEARRHSVCSSTRTPGRSHWLFEESIW